MTPTLLKDTNVVTNQKTYICPQTCMKPNFFDRSIPSRTVSADGMTLGLA
jgi:hypothetical protein